jgi:SET domain-containing protein
VLHKKQLTVKESTLPGAAKGLFTEVFIPKGARVTEYKGKVTTWAEAEHQDGNNFYLYYIDDDHVIDGAGRSGSLARYANDARGLVKVKGIKNNVRFVEDGYHVFMVAIRDIQAGEELLVAYGKEYWDTIKANMAIPD